MRGGSLFMVLAQLAILTLGGSLTDVKETETGEHSCLVSSPIPITRELLDVIQGEIAADFSISSPEKLKERHEHPFATVKQILAKYDLEVVDVADISTAKVGGTWINEAGYNYHTKKLQRLSF